MTALRAICLAVIACARLAVSGVSPASAHPLAPALLTLREAADGTVAATLRVPLPAPRGIRLAPRLPARCRSRGPARTSFVTDARLTEEAFDCEGSLAGDAIEATGIESGVSQLVVRLERVDGTIVQGLLAAHAPRFLVPVHADTREVVRDHFMLGAMHFLGGLDHLLFLGGLALLARGRRLVFAITCFTAGHAVSVSLVALRGTLPAPAAVEIAIAATLVALGASIGPGAGDASRSVLRRPALWPIGFGLIHGLGFASALADAGLPSGALPLAVAAFHAGIEFAQVALILVLLPIARNLARHLALHPEHARAACAHGIGGVGAWLVLDRTAALFGVG